MNPQILIIIFILISYFGLYLFRPKYALFLFIGILPLMHKELFSIYQWDFLPARFAVLGLGLGLIVKLLLLFKRLKYAGFINHLKDVYLNDRLFLILLLIFGIKAFAAIASGSNILTNQFIIFFALVIVLYSVVKHVFTEYAVKEKTFAKELIFMYLSVGSAVVTFAYAQMYFFYSQGIKIGAIWPVPKNLPRLGSLFWDVNHFGGYLVTLIPVFFFLVFGSSKIKYKLISFFGLGASSVALFLTQSRSSWLGLAVGMMFGVILLISKKNFKPVLLFLIGSVLMAGIFFVYLDFKDLSIRQKIASYMHYRLDSTDTHVMLLEGAVQIYVQDPLLGAGPGNFDSSFRNTETSSKYFEREPNLKTQKVPPHSVWGELISETGYLGFGSYILMCVFILLSSLYVFFNVENKENSYLALGLFVSMISILITGIFYSYNLEFYWMFIFTSFLFSISSLGARNISFGAIFKWASTIKYIYISIIFAISAFFIFINLGGVTLLEWDEAIYAKVAKNMFQSGNLLNLYWEQIGDRWFEKPPLYFWLSALTFQITGPDEFGARLWSAIFGVATVLSTYLLGRKMFNKFSGFIASLILISTAHFLYYARTSQLDVPVSFFIVMSILTYVYAIDGLRRFRFSLIFFIMTGVFVGLGVMTKAVVGLIPLIIILLNEFSVLILDKKRPRILGIITIVISALIIAGPWHIYSYIVYGSDFIDTYFFKHIFDRSTEGLGHTMPIWWYTDVLRTSLRIWIFPLVAALLYGLYKFRINSGLRLASISVFFIFLLFSASKDKLLWYIVPIYPFSAILIGAFINDVVPVIYNKIKSPGVSLFGVKLSVIVGLTLFVPFYITTIKDKIFYEDENESIVELIKVHNQLYPISEYPKMKLRYATVPHTVILFYSDHEPDPTEKEELLDQVKKSSPDNIYTYLITENRFYEMRGRIRDEFPEPYDLRIKASSGRYVIARAYSNVELIQEKVSEVKAAIFLLEETRAIAGGLSEFDLIKLDALQKEYIQLSKQLDEKGYPIQNKLIFK